MDLSNRELERLYDFIRDTITHVVNSNSLMDSPQKPTKIIGAKVVSVNGNDITVTLAGENSNRVILNLTNQTLAANDTVEVVIKNGNYGNAFIGWKRP